MLNASIFGNMLAQPKSPEEYLAERQQLEQGKMANMLNLQKLDEYSRGVERQNQLRNLLATGPDSNALRQAGFLQEASDWDKNAAEAGLKRSQALKAEADAQQTQLKAASDRLGMIYNAASGAKDQQSYSMARAGLQAAGIDVSAIPEMFDPAYVENAKTQALTQMQRVEAAMRQAQQAEAMRHNRATEGIQIRGQNISASTARRGQDIAAQTAARGQDIADARAKAASPSSGNATEAERNAAGYLMRMQEATKLLDKYEGKGAATYSTEAAGGIPFFGSMARRAAMSPDQQLYRQAQEDWVRAKLRKESGASIASDEMEREIETYFPMPGDSKEVIEQKRKARLVANDAFRASAGRAAAAPAPAAQGGVIDFGSLK